MALRVREAPSAQLILRAVADGNGAGGGTDCSAALQDALDGLATQGGGALLIPFRGTGIYRLDNPIHIGGNTQVRVDNGVKIDLTHQTNTSAAPAITVAGTVGAEINLAIAAVRLDETLTTAAPHGLVAGDWALLKSTTYALTSDAPDAWRLGETTANTTSTYFAEPIEALAASSATEVALKSPVIFPVYGLTAVGAGLRGCSTVQRIAWLDGFEWHGGEFLGGGSEIFRVQWARHPLIEDVEFTMGEREGYCVQYINVLRGRVVRPRFWHAPGATVTFRHNSIRDVGSWWCRYEDWTAENGFQPIDITFSPEGNPSIEPELLNGYSVDCDYGWTTHAGSFGGTARGIRTLNCRQGGQNRSRFFSVLDCRHVGARYGGTRAGILLGAWAIDGVYAGNHIDGYERGICDHPDGIVSNGPYQRNNVYHDNDFVRCNVGIFLPQLDAAPATTEPSGNVVTDNRFTQIARRGVQCGAYVNDVLAAGNQFSFLGDGAYGLLFDQNSVGHVVVDNRGTNIGATATLYNFGTLSDMDTFPPDQYPTNRTTDHDNTIVGPGILAYLGSSTRNLQTGAAYTFQLFDAGKTVFATGGAAQSFTIPANADVPFRIKDVIKLIHQSSFGVTIVPAVGVTTNAFGGLVSPGRYTMIQLEKVSTDTWAVTFNSGAKARANGNSRIQSGTTARVVTHGLNVVPTPEQISVTFSAAPTNEPGTVWIDTITSTQFTLHCRNDPGASNLDFSWVVQVA